MSIEAITAIVANYETTYSMTEVFTPPPACATSWTYEPEQANDVTGGLLMQNAATFEPTCFPSSFSHIGRVQASAIYSPGYCPVGYTSADVAVDGPTTTAICCLSDFDYYTSTKSYGTTYSDLYAGCISIYPSNNSTIVPVRQETTKTQVVGPVTMWAQPITVALEAGDSSLFVTPTTSSTASIASKTPTTTTVAETGVPTAANRTDDATVGDTVGETVEDAETEKASGGLSTTAAIGLGVGVGVGGLAVFAAVGLWLWRSRKTKKRMAPALTTTIDRHISPERLYYRDETSGLRNAPPNEIDGRTIHKNQYLHERHELDG